MNTQAINDLAAIFEKYNGMGANDALRTATLNIELKNALANGTATFTFRKADGTIRTATGTNKHSIVPNFYTFKGDTRAKSPKVHKYFDLERGEFRCYTRANLISIVAAA